MQEEINFINNYLNLSLTEEEFKQICSASHLLNKVMEACDIADNPFMFFRLCEVSDDGNHQSRIRQVEPLCGKRVLDYGGGIGRMAGYLADHRHKVDYYDINKLCRAFVKKHYPQVKVITAINQLEKYDTIVCFDVLPYIKDLDALGRLFKIILAPGGKVHTEVTPQNEVIANYVKGKAVWYVNSIFCYIVWLSALVLVSF